MTPSPVTRWCMGGAIALMLLVVPFYYYRATYSTHKRLRVVTEGKVYRSGCMTADGFRDAIRRYGIRTVLNLQEEASDPDLRDSYFSTSSVRESQVCREMGVRYEFLSVDLVHPKDFATQKPATIERFLKLMDDPNIYPVLIHCRAGLHRTGCVLALYRMEYEGWSKEEALRELKAHGFGEAASTAANEYIVQYVLRYEPRTKEVNHAVSDPPVPAVPVSRTREE